MRMREHRRGQADTQGRQGGFQTEMACHVFDPGTATLPAKAGHERRYDRCMVNRGETKALIDGLRHICQHC
jgi:hypothetical protein